MEILELHITEIAVYLGIAITSLALLLLIITSIVHWLEDRRLDRSMLFDRFKRPMIMSYLDGHTPKLTVIRALEKKPTQAMELLLEMSRKLQPEAQARLLPLFADLPHVEDETNALHSRLTKRRIAAAERLGLLQNESSDQALLDALHDEVLAVRYSAACSLAAHCKPEHIEPILQAFDAEHEINWYRLVEIMVEFGEVATPALLSIIDNPQSPYSHNIVNVAIRALGILKERRAVPALIEQLKSTELSIRLNAAHALGDIGDPAAINALSELRNDSEWVVRADAIEAMGKLHPDDKLPELIEALHDTSWWARYCAAQTICSLGPAGIKALRGVMHSTHDPHVHDVCIDVLSEQEVHSTNQHLSVPATT